MVVRGTPKSSILVGLSGINHPFWGTPMTYENIIMNLNVNEKID